MKQIAATSFLPHIWLAGFNHQSAGIFTFGVTDEVGEEVSSTTSVAVPSV